MNPAAMMAQVKRMQAEMVKAQGELAETIVTGSAAGGAVSVEVSCDNRVRSVKFGVDVVDPNDTETLEDLVVVAVNDALQRAAEVSAERMNAITGGMRIPGIS